ncbi:hypothetical protein D5086_021854 [Populus alba]|uniref:Uncharacterized protein n=1 Tax=Populus alba TaxID=43335 RepID=A0ACC4BDV7_POPAL
MFNEMQEILAQLKEETLFTPKEALFCDIINFYGRARLPENALKLFDELPSFRVQMTVKSYNSLLSVFLMCKDFDKMRELFVGIEKLGKADACTYNLLIRGLKEAFKLKTDMVKVYRVYPNAYIYASLIKGVCKNGELSLAFRLKKEMIRNKIELDPAIYSTLISGLFKAGRKEEALGVWEDMKERGILFDGFCNGMQFKEAAFILDEMIFKGFVPCSSSICKFVNRLCEGKNEDLLRSAFNTLEKGKLVNVDLWRMAVAMVFKDDKLSSSFNLVDSLIDVMN